MQMPARGFAALALLYDLICSYLRCRSANLAQVQSNFCLLMVPIKAASAAKPHSAGSLPPSKRHTRLTIVRRGCWMCRNVGIHGEAMYTAPDYPQGVCHIRKAAELPTAVQCAARAALQAPDRQCRGARGAPLAFSWGSKGAILSRERMAPFIHRSPWAAIFFP